MSESENMPCEPVCQCNLIQFGSVGEILPCMEQAPQHISANIQLDVPLAGDDDKVHILTVIFVLHF